MLNRSKTKCPGLNLCSSKATRNRPVGSVEVGNVEGVESASYQKTTKLVVDLSPLKTQNLKNMSSRAYITFRYHSHHSSLEKMPFLKKKNHRRSLLTFVRHLHTPQERIQEQTAQVLQIWRREEIPTFQRAVRFTGEINKVFSFTSIS